MDKVVNVNCVSVDIGSDGNPPEMATPPPAAPLSEQGGRSCETQEFGPAEMPASPVPDQAQVQEAAEQPQVYFTQENSAPTDGAKVLPTVNNVKVKYKIQNSRRRHHFEPRVHRIMARGQGVKPSTSHVSKVASYSTPLLRQKYVFPAKQNEAQDKDMYLQDDRTMLEVLEDVIGVVTDHYKEHEVEFLSRQCGYDASVRMFSKSGQPLPQPLLKDMIKSYKELKGLKSVGKAVQELARTEDKLYHVNNDQIEEVEEPAGVNVASAPQDTLDIDPDKLLAVTGSFITFINDNEWILTSTRLKRQFRIFKNKLKSKRKLTSKLVSFLKNYYVLYYNEDSGEWIPPVCDQKAFPGHVFYVARGEKLKYLPCSLLSKSNKLKRVLFLADSGASHNLIMEKTLHQLDLDVFPIKKRRLHLFTASGEEKDTVKGECVLELLLEGQHGRQYRCSQPFLVVDDSMNMERPILGMPFLINQGCQADYEQDSMSARLTNMEGEQVRVMLPAYRENPNNPKVATIKEYSDIYEAPVSCFSLTDFSPCSEVSSESSFGRVDDHCSEQGPEDIDCGLRSPECAARALAAQCHLVYPHTPAHQVFTDLGGQGDEVPLELREEADEQIFREIDLMNAGDDVREHRDMGKIDTQFLNHCSGRLDKLLKEYDAAFASDTRKIGKFKYFQYTPDVKEGTSSKQAIRSQKTMHFKNVQEKIKTLEENGIIGISPDQSTQYVHNLLFLSKRKATEAGRNATKADLHIAGHHHRLTDPDIKVRCINDLSDFNRKCLKATPTIYLPTQGEIQDFVKGKCTSSFDITEMFSSIPLHPDAYKYFNFYLNEKIYCFKVLLQGCSASPFIATEALQQTFGPAVWEALQRKLQDKLKMLFHYYDNYFDFVKSFMDDILLASYVICRCPGGHCSRSFQCPTMQFEETAELHCQCIEALYFAISEAGFLLNPEKSQYFVHSGFVFVGLQFNAVNQSFSIAEDRVKSIMAFRTPRSIPEVHSRVSSLRWSSPFLPYLNKILLPLIQLCAENKGFHWEKRHMEAYNNAKFLVGLCLQKYAFNPDRPHILVSDSSKYSLSYTLYTIDPCGIMQLCETDTKICSGAESRLQAVNRELICLLFAIRKCEKYIFASKKSFVAVGDFASILYLQLNAPHDSRVGEASIYLSKFTHQLKLVFASGRHMGLCDMFSRQFSNVYLKREDTHISKTLAQHLPPIPEDLRRKIFQMDGEQLCDYVFGRLKKTHLDLWDHANHVLQNFRLNDFKSMFKEVEPLQVLLRFLKNPYDLKNLDFETLREYFMLLRDSTKTNINQFLKDEKLLYLKDVIQSLDFETNWKKVYGVKPPSPAAVSLYSQFPSKGDPATLDSGEDPATVSMVTGEQCAAVERMCLPYGFVSAVTRSQTKPVSVDCPTDPDSVGNTDTHLGCAHYQVARAQHGRFPAKSFQTFCSSYQYWNNTAQNLKQLLSGLHSDISSHCQKSISQIDQFLENPCLVVKFFVFRDIFITLAQTRPSDWLIAINPSINLLTYCIDPSSDYVIKECSNHLLLCLKRDVTLDGMEQLELLGSVGFLSEDVVIEQIGIKPVIAYHQSAILNISLLNGVSLFNSSVYPVTLPSQTPIFKIYCSEQREETLFASIKWAQGQEHFSQILSLMSYNAERHLTSVFSDYLSQTRERLLEAAQEAEEGVMTRLRAPAQVPGQGGQDQDQDPDQEAPGPEEDDYQGPVTRARRRKLSDPLCTACSVSGLVDVFSVSDFNAYSTSLAGNVSEREKVRRGKRHAYHGQQALSQLLFSHYMRKSASRLDRDGVVALQRSDNHLLSIRQALEDKQSQEDTEDSNLKEKTSLYMLENGILYKNMYIREHDVTYKALALPQFLVRLILINLHNKYNIHLDSTSMYYWLRLHVYCFDLMPLIKSARSSCAECLYSFQAKHRTLGGDKLMYRQLEHLGPGSVLYTDMLFLAYDKAVNANSVLIIMDAITKYVHISVCKNKSSYSIINAFKHLFCNIPTPAVLVCDAGSEFVSSEVREFLNKLGIEIHYTSSKNSQLSETHIRVFKSYLNKMIQSQNLGNNQWSEALIPALMLLNSRPPSRTSVLSRSQLYFSPLHFFPAWYFNVKTEAKESANLHKSHLKCMKKGRVRFKPKKPACSVHAQRGNIVVREVPRSVQKSVNNSQQLLPSFDRILKIQRVLSGGKVVIAKDLMDGNKVKHNISQLRPLNLDKHLPFPNNQIRLEHLSNYVGLGHGVEHARNLTSLPAPKSFCVADTELPPIGQTQPSVNKVSQSEARAPTKSILKKKSQVIHQPYHGVLSQDQSGRDQFEAYLLAFDNLMDLQETDPDTKWRVPSWLDNLVSQPAGHGRLYGVMKSSISAPLSCSHQRRVHYNEEIKHPEYKSRYNQSFGQHPRLCQIYSVSEKELSVTQLTDLSQLEDSDWLKAI